MWLRWGDAECGWRTAGAKESMRACTDAEVRLDAYWRFGNVLAASVGETWNRREEPKNEEQRAVRNESNKNEKRK